MIDIINQIRQEPILFIMFLSGFVLIITTFLSSLNPKRVKAKKRVIRVENKKILKVREKIDSINALAKIKDWIGVQLGFATSKNKDKNDYYATIVMIIIGFVAIIMIIYVMFLEIPLIFKLLIYLLGVLVPIVILDMFVRAKRKKFKENFPLLVSVFIAKYSLSKNVKEALKRSIPDVPTCYHHELRRLVNALNSADGADKALDDFDRRVDYILCSGLVDMLKSSYSTSNDIISNLMELATYVANESNEEGKHKENIRDKKTNIYFWISLLPIIYWGMISSLKEQALEIYWHTIQGQLLMFSSIVVSIIAVIYVKIEERI